MFQIFENQVTDNRLFLEDSESGAGPDLNKPCWTWIYLGSSHQVLPPLYLGALGSLYGVCVIFYSYFAWSPVAGKTCVPAPDQLWKRDRLHWNGSVPVASKSKQAQAASLCKQLWCPHAYCRHRSYCCL